MKAIIIHYAKDIIYSLVILFLVYIIAYQSATNKKINSLEETLSEEQKFLNEQLEELGQKVAVLDESVSKDKTRKIRIDKIIRVLKTSSKNLSQPQMIELAASIIDYSDEYEVPVHLLMAIIKQESYFNPKAFSPAGAEGLMQIMPHTADFIKASLNTNRYDAYKIRHNIRFGTYYISEMMRIFKGDEVASIMAYNSGPEWIIKYRAYKKCLNDKLAVTCTQVDLPQETINFSERVLLFAKQYKLLGLA